jgi:peptidoglycan/LPS O-acetylase OafA/YrhL
MLLMATGTRTTPIPGLELLRGLAALAVCLGHVRALSLPPLRSGDYAGWERGLYFLTLHGEAAVWIFFVLSGYLMGGSVLRQVTAGSWRWSDYLLRRGTRLWVVLIPALLLTWACDQAHGSGPVITGGAMTFPHPLAADTWTFLGNLLFLQDMVVPPFGSNLALWSLAYEWWLYLLFPLLVLAARSRAWRERCLLAVLAAGIFWLLGPRGRWLSLAWLVGALVAQRRAAPGARGLPGPRLLPWLGLAAALAAKPYLASPFPLLAMPVIVVATVGVLWGEAGRTDPLPAFAVQLGSSSYTLYAIHVPLAILALTVVSGPFLQEPGPTRWLAVFGLTGGLLLFAQGWWWLFERRTDSLRQALTRRRPLS